MLVQITQATLSHHLQGAELALIPADTQLAHISEGCNQVAGYVNASGRYPWLASGKDHVPSELASATHTIIRDSLLATYPGANLATELEGQVRASQSTQAHALLNLVAKGELELASWDDDEDDTN